MQLAELFSPERITKELAGSDKEQVLKELIDLLVSRYGLDCGDEVFEAIREREQKMSTGIREGIAVPHGKSQHLHGIYGVLGISPTGIDYDALDGKKVKLFFLIASSENESDKHLEILKKIALCVEHEEFYGDLLKADDPERINEVLSDYEARLQVKLQD
jgi:PTS system nitrogen regulatory IIA component